MAGKYLLGFDIGTSESKGTLTDLEGHIIATAAQPHDIISPRPGFAEHDPNTWIKDFISVKNELLLKAGGCASDISCIAISAIMAAVVFTDEEFNPLRNAILYGIDTRCVKQCNELNDAIGYDRMLKEFGTVCTVEHYGPKILWVRENEPEVYKKTKHITFDAGLLVGRLTGENVVDRYSNDSCFPVMDGRTYEYVDEYCDLVCDKSFLPRIIPSSYEIVGTVTKKAASEFGLTEGTKVIVGTTDSGPEAVSAGVIKPGDTMIMYGSTAFFVSLRSASGGERRLGECFYVINDLYCAAFGMATTGSLTKWLKNTMCKDLVEAEKAGGMNCYEAMFKEAESIAPGSNGLIVLPYFQGERSPMQDPDAKGVMFGLSLSHTRGHIIKAALEGIGYGIDQNMELLRQRDYDPCNVTAVGGGTKAPLWVQTVSDICGFAQKVPEVTIGASYGDALLAAIAIGSIGKPEDIESLVKIKYIAEPDMKKHERYQELKAVYKELYERNADIMHML